MTRPHVEKEGSSRCAGCDHTFGQHDLSPLAAEAAKHGMPGPCLYGFGTWMRCECHGFRSEQPAAPSPREDWKRGAEDLTEEQRLKAVIHHMTLELESFGKHEPECNCAQDTVPHAADCKDCECGLVEAIAFGVEQSGLSLEPPPLTPEEQEALHARTVQIVEDVLAASKPTAPSRGAEADEAAARGWLDRWFGANPVPGSAAALHRPPVSMLARFRALARREAAEEMREVARKAACHWCDAERIRALPLPGSERAQAVDDPCYCCRQSCEPGCRCQPVSEGAEREVEGYPMCASCGQPKVNHAGGLYCPTKDGRTFSPGGEDRDRDNYPKDARHWREQPPEPRRIGGRTREEWRAAFDRSTDNLRRDREGTEALLSSAFSEPSR